MSLLVLSASDVDRISSSLSPDELMVLMASVFTSMSSAKGVYSPHRTSIQTRNHNVLFMPSHIDSIGTAVKVVSVPTSVEMTPRGLLATTLVMDEVSGSVRAIVNAKNLTAIRTAAGETINARCTHSSSITEELGLYFRFSSRYSCSWPQTTSNSGCIWSGGTDRCAYPFAFASLPVH
jgi:ornithine cyclodeaminase/alanine dehydrogenase-like protein (mu-crystallin family)